MRAGDHIIRTMSGVVVALLILLCTDQQASAIGQCRSVNCPCTEQQLKQGMVDTPQGCSKCNRAALAKAKADYERYWAQYKEVSRSAEDVFRQSDVALQEGWDELEKFWMGELYGKLPQMIRIYFNKGTEEDIAKEAFRTFKSLLKKIGDDGWTQSVKIAYWLELVTKMGFLIAKIDTKLKEFEMILNEAIEQADRAYELLQKARMAKERMEALEKDCQSKDAGGGKSGPADEGESSDEREEEAAREFLKSLRKVEGGYMDMADNFYEANKELDRAYESLHKQQGAFLDGGFRVLVRSNSSLLVEQVEGHMSLEQARKLGQLLSRAFDRLARAFEALDNIKSEYKTVKSRL